MGSGRRAQRSGRRPLPPRRLLIPESSISSSPSSLSSSPWPFAQIEQLQPRDVLEPAVRVPVGKLLDEITPSPAFDSPAFSIVSVAAMRVVDHGGNASMGAVDICSVSGRACQEDRKIATIRVCSRSLPHRVQGAETRGQLFFLRTSTVNPFAKSMVSTDLPLAVKGKEVARECEGQKGLLPLTCRPRFELPNHRIELGLDILLPDPAISVTAS